MKKVLVTGATGFIGNYVIAELLHRHYQVIATSSSTEKASQQQWFNHVTFLEFDLRALNPDVNYFNFCGQPDLLIHLAWEGLPNYKSDFHLSENFPRHLFFLSNLIRNGLRDLTVAGTCYEYGMQEGKLDESMEPKPANSYALAKDELRRNLEITCGSYSVSLKWIRLFYMYGRGQHPNSLISQLDKALEEHEEMFDMSGGEQQRDFLPVETVAEYIVRIAIQNKITGIINCCSGMPVSIKDFVAQYLKQKDKHISLNLGHYPYPDYEPMIFWGDDTKLKLILKNEQSDQ